MQWFLAAYTLAFAISLVTSARIGDIVGRRTMFLIGMAGLHHGLAAVRVWPYRPGC